MQNYENDIAEYVRSKGLRYTKTKEGIISLLSKAHQPLTAMQLVAQIDSSHFVSVYRSIDALMGIGVLKTVFRGLKPAYELSDRFTPHHHHLYCTACSKIEIIDDQAIEKAIQDIAAKAGYRLESHQLELSGRCSSCSPTNS